MKTLAILLSLLTLQCYAQEWESIETPVTSNLILFDIDFPTGQDEVGYTGGSNQTFNGQGTILKTEDAGSTWEVIWSSTVGGTGVTALHFFNPSVGMAGLMNGTLLATIDGGTLWVELDIDSDVDQGEIRDIEFFDLVNGAMITAWEGIYVTSNGGGDWTQATSNYLGAQSLAYADADNLFAGGGEQRIYGSSDGGMNWSQVFQGPNGNMQWINIGIGFYDANNGLVTSEEGQIFITDDGGATWTTGVVAGQFGLMRGVHYVTSDEVYIAATPGQVYVSEDAGANWDISSPLDFDPSYYEIIFTDNGTGFVSGSGSTGGTILRRLPASPDGILEFELLPLTVHPNPAVDVLQINTSDLSSAAVLKIYNSLGELVLDRPLNDGRIDVSTLAIGQYHLTVTGADGALYSADVVVGR